MKISIEVQEEYLKELIDKNFDKDRFKSVERLDLVKEEIFDMLLNDYRNDGIIIRAGYSGFNSNSYFITQIRCAWAQIYRRDFLKNESKNRKQNI